MIDLQITKRTSVEVCWSKTARFDRIYVCRLLPILVAVILFLPVTGHALDLDSAKTSGLVGETPSGYLEAVSTPTGEVSQLVSSINAQRKAKYQEIASKNGTSLSQVEKLAGNKAISNTQPGNFVKSSDGRWAKK